MKAALIADEFRQERHDTPLIPLLAGTVIDHPDAWQLVVRGIATAADDECLAKVKATATDEQIQEARDRQSEVRAGMQPMTEGEDSE